ncbi:MAG: TonB-dependent receptor, partial [Pseudomonadota bacterium]
MFGLAEVSAVAATLDVAVQTADGTLAAGRQVTIDNPGSGFSSNAVSNSSGRARFVGVPAGQGYRVLVDQKAQFANIDLRSNERRALRVRLSDAAVEDVLVTGQRESLGVNVLDAEVRAGLTQAELQALPVEARDLTRALIRLPNVVPSTGFFPEAPPVSINGANGLYTQYLVDGLDNNENFLGGPKFPISVGSIADVSVLAASYSAQYGRTGNGVINVTSRSGTNDWQGEAFYLTRPGAGIDASSPFAQRDLSGNAVRDGFRRDQLGFSIGGPIVTDRTFVFANVELTEDAKDNLLNAPELGALGTVPGENRTLLGTVKLDHTLNDDWRLALRVNRGDVDIERQGGGLDGGVTFPSAGSVQRRNSLLTALSATYDRGNFTSETSLQFSRFDWDYAQPFTTLSPQVAVELPSGLTGGVLGHPGFAFDNNERSW